MLKSYLKKAQDDVVALLDEKRKLLDTVRNLQVCIILVVQTTGLGLNTTISYKNRPS